MRIHVKAVHNGVKAKCEICSKEFNRAPEMRRHMRAVHKAAVPVKKQDQKQDLPQQDLQQAEGTHPNLQQSGGQQQDLQQPERQQQLPQPDAEALWSQFNPPLMGVSRSFPGIADS